MSDWHETAKFIPPDRSTIVVRRPYKDRKGYETKVGYYDDGMVAVDFEWVDGAEFQARWVNFTEFFEWKYTN